MPRNRNPRCGRNVFTLEPLEGRKLLSVAVHPPAMARSAVVDGFHPAEATTQNSGRWSWLANTDWYVPESNLAAVIYEPSSGTLVPVADQTVYHISGYREGYFWGETVTQLGSGSTTSSALVGSVTPEGRVLLNFNSGSTVTQGIGVMTRKFGRWTMENQMFTASTSGAQVGHWAYMLPTRPGMKSWESLPSVGVSVPTFLSNYSAPIPTPVV